MRVTPRSDPPGLNTPQHRVTRALLAAYEAEVRDLGLKTYSVTARNHALAYFRGVSATFAVLNPPHEQRPLPWVLTDIIDNGKNPLAIRV